MMMMMMVLTVPGRDDIETRKSWQGWISGGGNKKSNLLLRRVWQVSGEEEGL